MSTKTVHSFTEYSLTTGKEIQAHRLEAQEDPRSEEEAEQDPGGQGDRQGGQENEEQPGQGVRRQSLKIL